MMSTERTGKVLVVDDEPMNRTMLVAILRAEGHDALDTLEAYRPDIILLDVMMPVMDGFEATRAIKSSLGNQHIPIILLTSLSDQESRLQGLAAGAEDFVSRPIDQRELAVRVRNLMRLKHLNDFLEQNNRVLSEYDGITHLPNRRLFSERIRSALATMPEVGVITLHLHNLDAINNALGYAAGDIVLRSAASRLRSLVDESCELGCLGRSRFGILSAGVEATLEKLQALLGSDFSVPLVLADGEVMMQFRAGSALYPRDGHDWETLLRHAEVAMGQAHMRGLDTLGYEPAMDEKSSVELLLQAQLRRALDTGELVLFYQPKIDLADGRCVGVEALVRWRHPSRGLLAPEAFLSIAEKSGLIVPLGTWVLRTACAQLRAWGTLMDRPFGVSVNVAPKQFDHPALQETVARALKDNDLDPSEIELEVTESGTMSNVELGIAKLDSLHSLGVRLSMDDFGTGYSSLAYLKKFPLDTLKIDRSFVSDLPHEGEATAIVRAILGLASGLGLSVIAEGVETLEQADFLRDLGCQMAQGYLYARPMPASDVAGFLHVYRSRSRTQRP